MIIYALYYYDKPILRSFLSHYCNLKNITEILIQNQNWDAKDSVYLFDTVASYIDEYDKKIVVLPSQFHRIYEDGKGKRGQFVEVGIPEIFNRILQFLQGKVCIWGAMDEVIYATSYSSTQKELERVETVLKSASIGVVYMKHFCVYLDGFFGCGGLYFSRWNRYDWRCRIYKSDHPLKHRGEKVHDNSIDTFLNKEWVRIIPPNGVATNQLDDQPYKQMSSLRLLHYHTLIRKSADSIEWAFPEKKDVLNLKDHPEYYIERLPLK